MIGLLSTVPLLLLAAPLALAGVAALLQRWTWAQAIVAALGMALLALIALQAPLDQAVVFLGRDVLFSSRWAVLGRVLVFAPGDRPALAFIFVLSTLLFAGSAAIKTPASFAPVALVMLSLLMATLFVEPFLFAALFLVMTAAAGTVLLGAGGEGSTRGAMRWLAFVTMGAPFILLAGWQLEAYNASPTNPQLLEQARLLIMVGFVILLAVAPFHSWVPAVAEQAPPFAAAFVFTVVQAAVLFYLLNFLDQFEWMRTSAVVYQTFQVGGLALVGVGGLFAIGQRNLGRLLGYSMLIDLGATLLALSLNSPAGVQTAVALLALRGLALATWGVGVGVLRARQGGIGFDDLRGVAWKMPFATAAALLGGVSLLGLPVTAGFVGRWALYQLLAAESLLAAVILLAANVGALLAYARAATAMLAQTKRGADEDDELFGFAEGPLAMVYSGLGVGLVLVIGIFPQMLLPAVIAAAQTFSRLMQ